MEETIGGNDVVEGFGAPLCIDVAAHVGEVAQQIKAVEEDGQVLLGQTFGDAGVPHQLVRVHGRFAVSSAAIHGHVGAHLHVPRQVYLSCHAILEGEGVDVGEILAVAGGMLVGQLTASTKLHLVRRSPSQREVFRHVMGSHHRTGSDEGFVRAVQIDAVVVAVVGILLHPPLVILRQREVDARPDVHVPVAIHIVGCHGSHARLLIIYVAHCLCVLHDAHIGIGIEHRLAELVSVLLARRRSGGACSSCGDCPM